MPILLQLDFHLPGWKTQKTKGSSLVDPLFFFRMGKSWEEGWIVITTMEQEVYETFLIIYNLTMTRPSTACFRSRKDGGMLVDFIRFILHYAL